MVKLAIPERIVTDEKSPINQHVEGGSHCPRALSIFHCLWNESRMTMLFDREPTLATFILIKPVPSLPDMDFNFCEFLSD